MPLEPDPKLVAHAEAHKAKSSAFVPVPSQCEVCSESFPSKMALKAHAREAHPKEPPFTEELRERFLGLLTGGSGFFKAARTVGVHPSTVKKAMKIDPAFAEAAELAEEEASEEIETKLREEALAGSPWAVKEWLTKRQKSRWGDEKTVNVNVNGQIVHSATALPHEKNILAIQATIHERMRLMGAPAELESAEIIDAEIID